MLRIGALICIVFFIIADSFVAGIFQNCNHEACEEYTPSRELDAINYMPPNEEQLNAICPQILRYLECSSEELKKCTGYDIAGLASSVNKTIAEYGKVMLVLSNLITEVCNVNTTLHKNYVENVECFNSMVTAGDQSCREEANVIYTAYRTSRELFEEEDDYLSEHDSRCVKTAYSLACFSIQLQKNCGEEARTTLLEFVRRLRLTNIDQCTEDEILALKTEFLDYAKFDEEERNFYLVAFEALSN